MNRLVIFALVGALCALATPAVAGDWHSGATLICSDCHVMHGSQDHAYATGGLFVSVGPNAPYEFLLRNETNALCLSCHDNQSFAPDVFGANGGVAMNRRGGALNADPAHRSNDPGYDPMDGHTLWSTDVAPGGTFTNAAGLECTDCHAQHGQVATQYRNLKNTGGRNLTYATGSCAAIPTRTSTTTSPSLQRALTASGAQCATRRSTVPAERRTWAARAAAILPAPWRLRGSGIRPRT
jgi:nitrate/TMAO reductase-like tetraheme cytochrome c subunit